MKQQIGPLRRVLALPALLVFLVIALTVSDTKALFSDQESVRFYLEAGIWCTYTMGYWKNHPETWPVEEITIGGVTYTKAEAIAILETQPRGDATYILAHQLIPAKLNVLQGADPSAVEAAIIDADTWLIEHPPGSSPSGAERQEGICLAKTLDDYNNGVTGPGHCDE